MSRTHSLPRARFDALAAGRGDPAAVDALRAAELSKHTLLLHAVVETAARDWPGESAAAELRSSYDLLAAVQRHAPGAVDAILLHPQVGAWAAHCLRRLRRQRPSPAPIWADLRHLGAIAAAAAVRAGIPFDAAVALHEGTVVLPTVGMARIAPRRSWSTGVVRRGPANLEVITDDAAITLPADLGVDGPGWLALQRLDATFDGHRIEVLLDDIDPFRDWHDLAAAPRLRPPSVDAWRRSLQDSWSLLVRHHPDRAAEIAVVLTSIVPLDGNGGAHSVSAASSDAFGAIASTVPPTALRLAATLVHEVQHLKLHALLDLYPLYEHDGTELHYAPWRSDPRPFGSLLHGTFAHLGLADFWLRQRHLVTGERAMLGHFEFERYRQQCSKTARWLAASGRLTELGARFVAGMQATLDSWRDQAVPAEAVELARDAATDHRVSWRLRNLRPDPDAVKQLAEAWAVGGRCPNIRLPPTNIALSRRTNDNGRLELLYIRLDDPQRFQLLTRGQPGPLDEVATATSADLAYVRGDYDWAANGYVTEIAGDPDDPDSWAGLALARSHAAQDQVTAVLLTCPELAFNVHREVREMTGVAPDPQALSSWLAELCAPTAS